MIKPELEFCYYCQEITKFEDNYPLRRGVYSYEGKISRCYWHAQFQCSNCGNYHHFSWLFWCPITKKLICGNCNSPKLDPVKFWTKTYSYIFYCEKCQSHHHDLLYSEYQGIHPVQLGFDLKTKSIVDSIESIKVWKPEQKQVGGHISLNESLKTLNNAFSLRKLRSSIINSTHFHSDLIEENKLKQNLINQLLVVDDTNFLN